MPKQPFVESSWNKKDKNLDAPLRPQLLTDFAGQEPTCAKLDILITAAKGRKEPLGHALFCGPAGLGKTTLAHIIANTMGTQLHVTSGPVIEKAGDLAGILTTLQEGDCLFIDEIHRLNRTIEEYLYPAMEDFSLDLLIDSGPSARSVQVKLNRFTLIGATTRLGLLTAPLRSRFNFSCRLDYYKPAILQQILLRSAKILHVSLTEEAALEIACRSRGTPRIANHLLRFVRDYAQIHTDNKINKETAHLALEMLGIDHLGLEEMDKKILQHIITFHNGGPVGVNSLAVALGEEASTLSDVYESYLIMQGFLKRTPRGREATALAYSHLGLSPNQELK